MALAAFPVTWIRAVAAPYLRGYRARPQNGSNLHGYWFVRPARGGARQTGTRSRSGSKKTTEMGFFVGYLLGAGEYAFLEPVPPECLVFAFVHPAGGAAHRRLVTAPDALIRKTFGYIRWLTHRPPRFVFSEEAPAALTRHQSMRAWPPEKYQHFSRNFFIETLAWLVRSGLVRAMLAGDAAPRPR